MTSNNIYFIKNNKLSSVKKCAVKLWRISQNNLHYLEKIDK